MVVALSGRSSQRYSFQIRSRLTGQAYCRLPSLILAAPLILFATILWADEPKVFELRVENRAVVGGDGGAIRVKDNDQVELRWTTDERVELHLHGYNIELEVRPGETATMSFEAFATGRYPITSHGFGEDGEGHSHGDLIYLEVHPR